MIKSINDLSGVCRVELSEGSHRFYYRFSADKWYQIFGPGLEMLIGNELAELEAEFQKTYFPSDKVEFGAGPVRIVKDKLDRREMFAAMAMMGICANPTTEIKPYGDEIAEVAVEMADALLKKLG